MNKNTIQKTIFIISSCLCICASAFVCIFTGLKYKTKNEVVLNIDKDDKLFYLKSKVTFQQKDLIKYNDQVARFVQNDDMFYNFDGLTLSQLEVGDTFKKGEIIGKKNDDNIIATNDGIVLNIEEISGNKKICCYFFNKFSIQLECDTYTYYSNDYKNAVLYANIDGQKAKMIFDSYDFSRVETENIFLVNFKCNLENRIVTENSFKGIFDEEGFLRNAVYTNGIFSGINEGHSFAYKDNNGNWVSFALTCEDIIDSYYEVVNTQYLTFDLFSVGDIYEID